MAENGNAVGLHIWTCSQVGHGTVTVARYLAIRLHGACARRLNRAEIAMTARAKGVRQENEIAILREFFAPGAIQWRHLAIRVDKAIAAVHSDNRWKWSRALRLV